MLVAEPVTHWDQWEFHMGLLRNAYLTLFDFMVSILVKIHVVSKIIRSWSESEGPGADRSVWTPAWPVSVAAWWTQRGLWKDEATLSLAMTKWLHFDVTEVRVKGGAKNPGAII